VRRGGWERRLGFSFDLPFGRRLRPHLDTGNVGIHAVGCAGRRSLPLFFGPPTRRFLLASLDQAFLALTLRRGRSRIAGHASPAYTYRGNPGQVSGVRYQVSGGIRYQLSGIGRVSFSMMEISEGTFVYYLVSNHSYLDHA